MIRINIYQAKTHLSRYLSKLKPGEVVLLCRRNVPIAELRALPRKSAKPRPWGLYKGQIWMNDDFNEPLPAEELAAWEGGDSG